MYLEVELAVDAAVDELAEVLLGADRHGAGQQQRCPQPGHWVGTGSKRRAAGAYLHRSKVRLEMSARSFTLK